MPDDVPDDDRRTAGSPDPDPAASPGLNAGGGVPPGETPPSADQTHFSKGTREQTPNQSPPAGNRTPMVITLVALAFVVVAIAVITVASFIPS